MRGYGGVTASGLVLAMMLVSSCGSGSDDGGGAQAGGCEEPIRVGILATLTGPNAALGANAKAGTNTAFTSWQEEHPDGLLGCEIEVVEADDASDPAQGLQAARDLIERQEVDVIIAGHPSTVALAISDYITESEIPMLTFATNEAVYDTASYPYNYAVGVTSGPTSRAVAGYAEKFGFERVVIAMEDSAYGEGQYAAVSTAFEDVGIAEVAYVKFPATGADLTSFAQQVKDAEGEGDFLYYCAQPPQQGRFTQALATVGLTTPIFGCQSFTAPELLVAASGALPLGSVGISEAPLLTHEELDNVARFLDAYEAVQGSEPPKPADAYFYTGALLWIDAVERAGTTDGAAVKAALDETTDFAGAQNEVTFTEDDHLSFDDPEEDFTPIFLVDAAELTCKEPVNGQSFCDPEAIREAGLELPPFAADL